MAVDGALVVFGLKGCEPGFGGARCGGLFGCGRSLLLSGDVLALLCQGLFACKRLLLGTLAGGGLGWLGLLLLRRMALLLL